MPPTIMYRCSKRLIVFRSLREVRRTQRKVPGKDALSLRWPWLAAPT